MIGTKIQVNHEDPANFGPGKQLQIGLLKEKMIAYAIL